MTQTRNKYYEAIDFLRSEKQENIVKIDADGSIEEVLGKIIQELSVHLKNRTSILAPISLDFLPNYFSLDTEMNIRVKDIALDLAKDFSKKNVAHNDLPRLLELIEQTVIDKVRESSINTLGSIFIDYLHTLGFKINDRLAWSDLDAFDIRYELPMGLMQSGIVLFVDQAQRIDIVLKKAMQMERSMSDFMFVFDPSDSHLVNNYFEREIIHRQDSSYSLVPNTKFITKSDLVKIILEELLEIMFFMDPMMSKSERLVVEEFIAQRKLNKLQRLVENHRNESIDIFKDNPIFQDDDTDKLPF